LTVRTRPETNPPADLVFRIGGARRPRSHYLILGALIQAFYKPAPEMKRFPSFFFNLLLLAGDMVVYPREYCAGSGT